jgi:hypothetical protein
MSNLETSRHEGVGARRWGRPQTAVRAVICTPIALVVLAAFPALAAAFAPVVLSPSAAPTSGGAHLSATIYPYGLDTAYHYEYGPTIGYGSSIPVSSDADIGSAAFPGTAQASQTITGLAGNTTEHFRLVAHNSDGTTSTPDQTFTTLATPPSVVANVATATAGGFDLSGTVNPHGADAKFRFEYGTTTVYGVNLPEPDGDAGSGSTAAAVSEEVLNTALLPNTTYHFRLVAQNSGGSAPSPDQTFTTPPSAPAAPSAVVNPPEAIAGDYRLKGAVNPNGIATHYHFEFGASITYGTNLPEPDADAGEGISGVAVSADVTTGLAPNTTYHYRIVANNSEGPGVSPDQTFTTAPEPPVVVATPFSGTAGGFGLNGTVNPNGGHTTYRFEFGFTTIYGSNIPATEVDAGQGTSPVSVSQPVGGLPPNVVYHYRLVAKNAGGVSKSNDEEFITPPATFVAPEAPLQPLLPAPRVSPPSNQFTVNQVVAKGTSATLHVSVPGPGTVSVSGKEMKAATAGSSGAGTVALKLKLTGAGLKALKKVKSHKLTVKIRVTFQPIGGSPGTTSRTVTFKG